MSEPSPRLRRLVEELEEEVGHAPDPLDPVGALVLRELGVRLVPSPAAEAEVDGYRGMRHTSARRYSYDDPTATIIVVSEDGPVSVLRRGKVLGTSTPA